MDQGFVSDDMRRSHGHAPVMRDRMVALVGTALADAGSAAYPAATTPILVDATLGAGGHSEALLETYPEAVVIGIDRDPAALAQAHERLAGFGDRFLSVHARFDDIDAVLDTLRDAGHDVDNTGISGALFDLGVSSMQLDQAERGFAYSKDAPLDMRMDPTLTLTAADVLNSYSHGDLARVLKTYGEEKFAGKIASAVLAQRQRQPFTRSAELVELLYATIPAGARRTGGHPAKRTFQALRVEVNAELEALDLAIPAMAAWLRPGAAMAFMSYQSLEDRIVKRHLVDLSTNATPPGLPVDLPGTEAAGRVITRGAERATEEEIELNARAAPARVRAWQRTTDYQHDSYPLPTRPPNGQH